MEDVPGEKSQLVCLRNPWGKNEWVGEWSDSDPKWNDFDLRKLLDHDLGDDGVFYMLWKDFLKYYSDFQICYFHDGYKYSAIGLTNEKNKTVGLKFSIGIPGKYYLSLNQ